MENAEIYARLPGAVLPWYEACHRALPWREDREPYHIWLSEIMLQQTRVEAVKGYYRRFLVKIPTVAALAAADDETLKKLWEGLGYYSRVRNLKKAAQKIVAEYGGVFPNTYDAVRSLPGVGDYTAGAICSIAFDLPTPAVDGNVLRVCARLTDDPLPVDLPETKASVRESLRTIYPSRAGAFTQALMELGATVCGPNRPPECQSCPCASFCRGYQNGTAAALPVRLPKREKRQEERTVLILSCGGRYALQKREGKGLLAGLWQFPNCTGTLSAAEAIATAEGCGLRVKQLLRQSERRHVFTHIVWQLRGFYLETAEEGGGFVWCTPAEIDAQYALPTAFRQFFPESQPDVP